MTSPDISSLLQRLEAAEEGSRELDVRIHALVANPQILTNPGMHRGTVRVSPEWTPLADVIADGWIDWEGLAREAQAPAYTTSLDASLTLLPEGTGALINATLGPWAQVIRDTPEFSGPSLASATAATPALALCIAALRVRLP